MSQSQNDRFDITFFPIILNVFFSKRMRRESISVCMRLHSVFEIFAGFDGGCLGWGVSGFQNYVSRNMFCGP